MNGLTPNNRTSVYDVNTTVPFRPKLLGSLTGISSLDTSETGLPLLCKHSV